MLVVKVAAKSFQYREKTTSVDKPLTRPFRATGSPKSEETRDADKSIAFVDLANGPTYSQRKVESVATILERAAPSCIEDWFLEVQLDSRFSGVPLSPEQRYGHLPQLFRDLVARLRAA